MLLFQQILQLIFYLQEDDLAKFIYFAYHNILTPSKEKNHPISNIHNK